MKRVIFSLLVFFSLNGYAENFDLPVEETLAPIEINQVSDKKDEILSTESINLTDKENKIGICIEDYKKKQSRSYAKIVQDNLYSLIYNFDEIASKIYGKKQSETDIAREEKIEALAKIQCEAYYEIGVLK